MEIPVLTLPKPVPIQRMRPPQENIPQSKGERDRISMLIRRYVAEVNPIPPMPMDELRLHADALIAKADCDPKYRDYVAVCINNEAWRDQLATIPFERRLLLMPKCLRVEDKCPAPFDEFGLLCKKCGLCSIQDLQEEAERLGYAVLCAEGSAIVTSIIQTGRIDAIVGVSCLSVLEKAFPHMEAAAIPGIAIPLLQDDCIDTNVDLDAVWEIIHLTSDDRTHRLDLEAVRKEVDSWFADEQLTQILGPAKGRTDELGRQWLAKSGKRWRPFLTVCAYKALKGDMDALPADLKKVALAVECFHKASLIHDDIEDNDATRYGEKTLHEEQGIPVALNVGDFLLGEGYRLIAECDASAEFKVEMLKVAALGHRTLSLGQGAELCWARDPKAMTPLQVLEIFRQKTAPAFEVALRLGALYAEVDGDVRDILSKYSEALGIAYQIRDDLEDLSPAGHAPDDVAALRPSLLLAVANERTKGEDGQFMEDVWSRKLAPSQETTTRIRQLISKSRADERCEGLYESYKEEAVRSLMPLENASLKGLLRRVMTKIFNDLQLEGWCSAHEAENMAQKVMAEAAAV
ncbi:MAG TPA: polyprenyl synthetase family protein [Tepidisphaeraceae bacterium]|jgi:geranylgeranyl pyrophosphate synthase|nr:polyprenyl synthetase family protein [Tepidisphaeraceae bacterium]